MPSEDKDTRLCQHLQSCHAVSSLNMVPCCISHPLPCINVITNVNHTHLLSHRFRGSGVQGRLSQVLRFRVSVEAAIQVSAKVRVSSECSSGERLSLRMLDCRQESDSQGLLDGEPQCFGVCWWEAVPGSLSHGPPSHVHLLH